MRRFVLVTWTLWLGVAIPAGVWAQTVSVTPSPAAAADDQATPASEQARPASDQATPPASDPAKSSQEKPAPTATAPEPSAAPTVEGPHSLFDQTWHQFQFGGRATSIDGDPARFQRYQDVRNGVMFTDARYASESTEGDWLVRAAADNVGYRDQRYFADYERTGRFKVAGRWDEIPQFYSVDTATPYTHTGDNLVLDDATQRLIQNGQGNLSSWIPLASQFELHERRDVGSVSLVATPKPQLDLTATYTMNRHVGELPWGASFGFGNDVEVALPYDSRTNDFNLGAQWNNTRNMLSVSYTGSWFNNLDTPLIWDSPLRLDDSTSAPGRGRTSLWPSNSAQTVSIGGFTKFAHRTQLTGFLSFGSSKNNETLQPFTINSALPQLPMPRTTTEGDAGIVSTNLNLVSRPQMDWRFSARFRNYDYSNHTPHFSIAQFVSYDTSVSDANTGGPELYAHSRTNFDADATWTKLMPLALTVGYSRNNTGHDFRIFENTGENVFRVTADAAGSQTVSFRAQYENSSRTGSGLNEDLLVQIGEQPDMRHYDVANRNRNKFTGQMDFSPNELWTFSASGGVGHDDFPDSYFGLEQSSFQTFSLGADFRQPDGWGAGVSYNYEHYSGDQRSRSASAGQTPPEETDPNRDWTVNSKERVNYFSIYANPPKIGANTEARFSYDYSYALGTYFYAIIPGGPLTPPNQLPDVYNKLQQLHIDVRHRISNHWSATLSYLFEPFRVYDFALDQSVVNSIVQPSSLVLGYVYRPYTANSFVFGARYLW
jgi:MtrB/PioB family decaheme-associated outer membrane protein